MKRGTIILPVFLILICANIYAQDFNTIIQAAFIYEQAVSEKSEAGHGAISFLTQQPVKKKQTIPDLSPDINVQKINLKTLPIRLLIINRQVNCLFCSSCTRAVPGNYASVKLISFSKNKYVICNAPTLITIATLSQSIPYFINSLKNIAILKLCCQKTACGASSGSYKKVTGLTFVIALKH